VPGAGSPLSCTQRVTVISGSVGSGRSLHPTSPATLKHVAADALVAARNGRRILRAQKFEIMKAIV
jgi:hypothetical protein